MPLASTKNTTVTLNSQCGSTSQAIIDCVWVCLLLQKLRRTPKTITLRELQPNPYENRYIRKMIDTCAFTMYGHWVKRGEEQNRAALFETTLKLAIAMKTLSIDTPKIFTTVY